MESIAAQYLEIANEWKALAEKTPTNVLQQHLQRIKSTKERPGDWMRIGIMEAELKQRGVLNKEVTP